MWLPWGPGTPGTGTSGSLDIMLQNAIDEANTGGEAIVILDVGAPIVINAALPQIDHTDGKITITKTAGDTE